MKSAKLRVAANIAELPELLRRAFDVEKRPTSRLRWSGAQTYRFARIMTVEHPKEDDGVGGLKCHLADATGALIIEAQIALQRPINS
jgi:hypothetical protein